MAFPTNPVNGQTTTVNGVIYTYSTALTAWSVTTNAGANVSANNIAAVAAITSATVSASGNISGSYFLGNGASLTGVITSVANINSGTSNVTVVSSGGNVTVGVGGTANVAVFATTGEYITGLVSVSGNITGGNLLTAGIMSSTGNATHGNVLTAGLVSATSNVTGGNITTIGLISATSTITAQGFISQTQTSNVMARISLVNSVRNWSISNYGNQFSPNGQFAIADETGGAVRLTITTDGITTITGSLSVTGNATMGNVLTAGIMSSTGNIIGGNILTSGLISATGNITGSYFLGNGSQLTGISSSSNTISNGNSNVSISTANGNITVGVTGTSNVVVWSSAGQYVTGIVSASGNIYSNGNVALGLSTANARLHVSGNIYATGDIVSSYSDERLKTRLGNIDRAVEKVLAIDTFYYEPNHTAITLGAEPGRQVGVSAQSVQQVQQETVTTSPLSSNYLTVKYDRLVPLLIAAVKEQQQAIEQLRFEISLLKKD